MRSPTNKGITTTSTEFETNFASSSGYRR
jgi:hypothetical protein